MKTARTLSFFGSLAALLAFSCATARAQSYYEIEGVIYGPGTRPVQGVVVLLEDVTRARVAQTITTDDGRYRFSRVQAGTYYIVASPNDRQLQKAAHRVELINTTRAGTNSSTERLDISLAAAPRAASSAPPGTFFAQDVPEAAEREYKGAMESLGKKENERAAEQLKRALAAFPNYFAASQQLGLLYVESEQFRQAVPPLVKAVEINPKAAPSYLGLGIASVKLGRPDLAKDALEHARRLDPKSYRVHFYLGLALTDLNQLDEAVRSLKEAHRLGTPAKFGAARLYLASIYSRREQHREALAELEAYLAENPNAANAAGVREAVKKLKAKL